MYIYTACSEFWRLTTEEDWIIVSERSESIYGVKLSTSVALSPWAARHQFIVRHGHLSPRDFGSLSILQMSKINTKLDNILNYLRRAMWQTYLWWEGTVWWLPIPPHTRLNTEDWGGEVLSIMIPNLMRAQVHSHLGLELQRRHYETSVKGWILTDTIEATVFLMIPFLFLCAPASDQIQHGILSSPCTPAQPWCHR